MTLMRFSPNGAVLAHVLSSPSTSTSTSISLRDGSSGRWRSTLQNHHNEASVTPSHIRSMEFADDEHLVVFAGNGILTVWDVTRSVVACRIPLSENELMVHAMATSTTTPGSIFVAVTKKGHSKIIVHQYAARTGKLLGKVKGCGKLQQDGDEIRIAVTDQYVLVQSDPSHIRILERLTGDKVSKISIDCLLHFATGEHCCAVTKNHQLKIFRLDSGVFLEAVVNKENALDLSQFFTSDNKISSQFIQKDDHTFWLFLDANTTRFGTSNGSSTCPPKLIVIQLDTDTNRYGVHTTSIMKDEATSLRIRSQNLCAVQLLPGGSSGSRSEKNHKDCQIQTLQVFQGNESADQISVTWNKPDESGMDTDSRKKRSATTILGPGKIGGEARGATEVTIGKRLKQTQNGDDEGDKIVDDDDDRDSTEDGEPTIAERLQQLQKAMDAEHDDDDDDDDIEIQDAEDNDINEEKFFPQNATTESLTQLLQQALQSGDTAMLELALQVRDAVLLQESCRQLEPPDVDALLEALTTRLARKPARAEHLCQWLMPLLRYVKKAEQLQPLQNLLQERLEVFPLLLQLEGRLVRMSDDTEIN